MGLLHTTGGSLKDIGLRTRNTKFIISLLTAAEVLRAADLAASCLRGALPGSVELRH